MNLSVDKAVRAVISDIIYKQEESVTDEKQTTISVIELLEREIERHRIVEKDTRKLEKKIQKKYQLSKKSKLSTCCILL